MCFSVKTPDVKNPEPAPTRATAGANAEADARRRTAEQEGIYGNIFTSLLGDAGFGRSTRPGARLSGTAAGTTQ